ncbi:MAG: dethiobiotin synthase [Turneriella sp.]|nr:dethiobiotin synthase [Turneriella sp.]
MAFFVAGTGTDVGKTIFSALMMARYARQKNLRYLKPVQTGEVSDRETIARLTNLDATFFQPEICSFKLAASPHFAAESENARIDTGHLTATLQTLRGQKVVIELAGGLMVPLSRYFTNLDLIRAVALPTVLVAATGLGTINHTVLSLRALQEAGTALAGIYFIGHDNPLAADNIKTITEMTGARFLGKFLLPETHMSAAEFLKAAEACDPDDELAGLI